MSHLEKAVYVLWVSLFALMLSACAGLSQVSIYVPQVQKTSPTQEVIVTYEDNVTSDRCDPTEVAELVVDFLNALNRGNREEITRFFGGNFQWYSVGEYNTQDAQFIRRISYVVEESNTGGGTTSGPRDEIIEQLLDYFAERHEQHEQMQLLEIASIGGGGDISYKIQRRADDLDVELWGPDFMAEGKGVVDCENQTVDVWSMAMNTPPPASSDTDVMRSVVCPTPVVNPPQNAVLACNDGWNN